MFLVFDFPMEEFVQKQQRRSQLSGRKKHPQLEMCETSAAPWPSASMAVQSAADAGERMKKKEEASELHTWGSYCAT